MKNVRGDGGKEESLGRSVLWERNPISESQRLVFQASSLSTLILTASPA